METPRLTTSSLPRLWGESPGGQHRGPEGGWRLVIDLGKGQPGRIWQGPHTRARVSVCAHLYVSSEISPRPPQGCHGDRPGVCGLRGRRLRGLWPRGGRGGRLLVPGFWTVSRMAVSYPGASPLGPVSCSGHSAGPGPGLASPFGVAGLRPGMNS